jgi:hypothetical protein
VNEPWVRRYACQSSVEASITDHLEVEVDDACARRLGQATITMSQAGVINTGLEYDEGEAVVHITLTPEGLRELGACLYEAAAELERRVAAIREAKRWS